MEIQGQILTIRHSPAIADENKRLKAEIVNLNWLLDRKIEEIAKLKHENASLRGTMAAMQAGEYRKQPKGKLQTRKGWIPPE